MSATARAALEIETFHHLFASVAEEMGAALMRSAFSSNIKERRDFSCALFDSEARTVAQAAHLPIHLGATPLSVREARDSVEFRPGDAVVLNDPYRGGTHLPDVTLITPVFLGGERHPSFYCANRAHHADIGGAHPGSMGAVFDVHGEGVRIPPIHLVREGEPVQDVLELLLANLRVPEERRGDFLAQWAAGRLGAARLAELAGVHGAARLRRRAADQVDWTERLTRAAVQTLPARRVRREETLELEDGDARLVLVLERRGDGLLVDFTESDDAREGPMNTTRAVVLSAVTYALRLLLPEGTPTSDGLLAPVDVLTRPGSIVDARYPACVAAGNVETSQRLVDLLLAALGELLPDRMPAASAGTMSNLTLGSVAGAPARFAYYETNAGGAGASPGAPGAHAVQTHMTNTRNTPIEALERELPVRVTRATIARGSGGRGQRRGGDGIVRELTFLEPCHVSWTADRQRHGPPGLAGGEPGRRGAAAHVRTDGRRRRLSGRASLRVEEGDRIRLETPGGGGHGAS